MKYTFITVKHHNLLKMAIITFNNKKGAVKKQSKKDEGTID